MAGGYRFMLFSEQTLLQSQGLLQERLGLIRRSEIKVRTPEDAHHYGLDLWLAF